MFSRLCSTKSAGRHAREPEPPVGIRPVVHSVLAVFFSSKEPQPTEYSAGRGINISGVDFWHAVEFSRNGRFLCTHPRTLSEAFLRALPFGVSFLRFKLYQGFSFFLTTVPQACKSGTTVRIK